MLESLARSQSGAHREVVRAKALLMAADGVANTAIAASLSVSPASVKSWRDRFTEEGLVKLGQVRKGRGRKPSIPQSKIDEIIDLTQNYRPKGETHWSCRTMAAAAGVSKSTVQLVWHARGLKPHRVADVQTVQRPAVRGETGRCRRAVHEPAREGDRVMRGREVLGAGIGPHAGVAADGQGARRDDDPRLQAARHHHPVRCPGRVDRHGDRAMHAAPPASGVVEVPARPSTARCPRTWRST